MEPMNAKLLRRIHARRVQAHSRRRKAEALNAMTEKLAEEEVEKKKAAHAAKVTADRMAGAERSARAADIEKKQLPMLREYRQRVPMMRLRGGGCGASTTARDDGQSALGTLPKAQQQAQQTQQAHPPDASAKYTELAPLREFLDSGDVALVRASHLLERAASGDIFLRRQDLPESAIADQAMIERSFREYTEWDAYLRTAPDYHAGNMRFPPFVIIS